MRYRLCILVALVCFVACRTQATAGDNDSNDSAAELSQISGLGLHDEPAHGPFLACVSSPGTCQYECQEGRLYTEQDATLCPDPKKVWACYCAPMPSSP